MRIRFGCRACSQSVDDAVPETGGALRCAGCGAARPCAAPAQFAPAGVVTSCPLCPSDEFYLQRDFPRRAGLAVMTAGGAAFLILAGVFDRIVTGFAVLGVVALLDLMLFRLLPVVTVCYRCRTELRGLPLNPAHAAFDHHVAEDAEKRARADRAVAGD